MDIDSVGPSPSGASGVAGNPATAQSGAPTFVMAPLQLEIPGQDMMDVEPGFSGQFTSSAPANLASVAISSPSPAGLGTRATPPIGGVSPGCSSPSVPHAGVSISHLAQVSSQAFSAPGLDAAGVVGLRPVPTPPVAVVTKSDVHSSPKLKLHELFIQWLLKPENTVWLNSLVEDVRSGKEFPVSLRHAQAISVTTASPASSASPASPASPVSRLILSHIPFGVSSRLVRHPATTSVPQHLSPSHAVISGDLDIGRSSVDRAAVFSSASGSSIGGRMGGDSLMPGEQNIAFSTAEAHENSTATKHADTSEQEQTDSLDVVADGIAGMKADTSDRQASAPMSDARREEPKSAVPGDPEKIGPVPMAPTAESPEESSGLLPAGCAATSVAETGMAVGDTEAIDFGEKDSLPQVRSPKVGQSDRIEEDACDPMDADSTPASVPSASLPPRASSLTNGGAKTGVTSRRRREIGQFYFPRGKGAEERDSHELEAIEASFAKCRGEKGGMEGVNRSELAAIIPQALSLPSFFAPIIFDRILQSADDSRCTSGMAPIPNGDLGSGATTPGETGNNPTPVGSQSPSMSIDNGAGSSAIASAGATPGHDSSEAGNAASPGTHVSEANFRLYYMNEARSRSREARLFHLLLPIGADRDYLITSDFKALLRALLMCHQGLSFLHATPEFQLRYSETVVERIFFSCTRKHNGRLTLEDIKRSRLLDTLVIVDEEEDINRERKYFSYEHFYVLYCRFWELDTDHDLQIDREDLMRYGGHSLTYRIVDRIFGGFPRRLDNPEHPGFMSYTDFIWFCLSEEDKNSDTAIDYWYRCIDMDGDGLITMYDMEYFYKEQLHRMECFGHEPVQVRDILCQLLDMVKPNCSPPQVKRSDLKACRLAGNFFNVLFNLNKFFALEARDPLQIRQEHATPELTDWDRFAALEYLRLSAEEEGEEEESWEEVGDAANPLIVEAPF